MPSVSCHPSAGEHQSSADDKDLALDADDRLVLVHVLYRQAQRLPLPQAEPAPSGTTTEHHSTIVAEKRTGTPGLFDTFAQVLEVMWGRSKETTA